MAQISIELGGDRKIRQKLRNDGYSEIRITKKGFSKIRAEACYGKTRYKLTIKRLGLRVRQDAKIGECRFELSPEEVAGELKADGLERISYEGSKRDNYIFSACDRKQRIRLVVDKYGESKGRKVIGRCRKGFSYADVRESLLDKGYDRIKLIKEGRGPFIVEACRRERRFEVTVGRRGRIRRERRIGTCPGLINPKNIAGVLAKDGYNRILVTDNKLPGYRAEACNEKNERVKVLMNRWGEIKRSRKIGNCEPPLSKEDVISFLERRGFNRLKVDNRGVDGYFVTGCYKEDKIEITADLYGENFLRKVVGRCTPPPRIDDLVNDYEGRRFRDVRVFVEACNKRRNRLIRFELNEYGEEVGRERLGRCK